MSTANPVYKPSAFELYADISGDVSGKRRKLTHTNSYSDAWGHDSPERHAFNDCSYGLDIVQELFDLDMFQSTPTQYELINKSFDVALIDDQYPISIHDDIYEGVDLQLSYTDQCIDPALLVNAYDIAYPRRNCKASAFGTHDSDTEDLSDEEDDHLMSPSSINEEAAEADMKLSEPEESSPGSTPASSIYNSGFYSDDDSKDPTFSPCYVDSDDRRSARHRRGVSSSRSVPLSVHTSPASSLSSSPAPSLKRKFSSIQENTRYITQGNGKNRLFLCLICGHTCNSAGDMKRHQKAADHQEREHHCSCGRSFTREDSLKRHQIAKDHLDENSGY